MESIGYKYHVNLVAFHLTRVCSHRCPMCYAATEGIRRKHPPFEKLIRVVDKLAEAKVREVSLLGGDPASYPRVIDLARYISERDMSVSIISNTFLFPGSSLDEAAKYISAFETTIHHSVPRLHDQFCRSSGAYNNIVQRLRILGSYGRPIGIAINITPQTSSIIFDIVDGLINIENVPVKYVVIQRIIPFGRAASSSDFTLTRKHAEQALKDINRIKQSLCIAIHFEDPFPICILPPEYKIYMHPCEWGITKVSVNDNGDVSRCGADNRYLLGNLFDTPLLDIWNNSSILKSFRSKDYLPGRCKICSDFDICSGGCPLSCEIEKDHGIDYLYLEYEKLDTEIHGKISFLKAKEDELSSILQIEWSNFPGYGHIFSVQSIKKWYLHNPNMFWVVKDARDWILGYSVLVPITKNLYEKICSGKFSSLNDFPEKDVLTSALSDYYYVEVVATVPTRLASRAGSFLIKNVGNYLLETAKFVATSPITEIGMRLCKYFEFRHVADEILETERYPLYAYEIDKEKVKRKISRF